MNIHNLGTLETQVIEILWKRKRCTVNDVVTELRKDRDIAYTTVATILHRLCVKGYATKTTSNAQNIYIVKTSKEEFSNGLVNAFINSLVGKFGDVAINSFAIGIESLPVKERKRLLTILQAYEQKK